MLFLPLPGHCCEGGPSLELPGCWDWFSETGLSEPGASAEPLVLYRGALLNNNLSQLA